MLHKSEDSKQDVNPQAKWLLSSDNLSFYSRKSSKGSLSSIHWIFSRDSDSKVTNLPQTESNWMKSDRQPELAHMKMKI